MERARGGWASVGRSVGGSVARTFPAPRPSHAPSLPCRLGGPPPPGEARDTARRGGGRSPNSCVVYRRNLAAGARFRLRGGRAPRHPARARRRAPLIFSEKMSSLITRWRKRAPRISSGVAQIAASSFARSVGAADEGPSRGGRGGHACTPCGFAAAGRMGGTVDRKDQRATRANVHSCGRQTAAGRSTDRPTEQRTHRGREAVVDRSIHPSVDRSVLAGDGTTRAVRPSSIHPSIDPSKFLPAAARPADERAQPVVTDQPPRGSGAGGDEFG